MGTLGIDVGVLDSDNMKAFKRMTVNTKKLTYAEGGAWLVTLSKISDDCDEGLAECAEEYAQRLAVDEERKQGWMWLEEPPEFWGFMKSVH